MSDPLAQAPVPDATKPKKGCWFYGCITLAVLLLLAAVGGFFAVRYVAKTFTAMVQEYSQTEPLKLPAISLTPEEKKDLRQRADAFNTALNSGKVEGQELVLSGEELTQLLSDSDPSGVLGKSLRIRIEGSEVRGTLSLPLERIGLGSLGSGRYLNGEASLEIALNAGNLRVSLKDLQIQGKTIPAQALAPLRSANLAEQFNADPKLRMKLDRFESIQVSDGRVHVRGKTK